MRLPPVSFAAYSSDYFCDGLKDCGAVCGTGALEGYGDDSHRCTCYDQQGYGRRQGHCDDIQGVPLFSMAPGFGRLELSSAAPFGAVKPYRIGRTVSVSGQVSGTGLEAWAGRVGRSVPEGIRL